VEGLGNPSILLNSGILSPDKTSDFTYLCQQVKNPTISQTREGEYKVTVMNNSYS
jgi:hypothetical protein